MSELKRIVRSGAGTFSRLNAKRQLRDVAASGPDGDRLARVLNNSISGSTGPSDRTAWVSKIERLRGQLEMDQTPVEIRDFGFGSSNDNRTVEEMEQGVLIERTISQQCSANKPAFWAGLLHNLVYEYEPEVGLELGTCLGVSAAYQGAAMERRGRGKLISLEGAASLAEKSSENIASLDLGDRVEIVTGRFSDTLPTLLDTHSPIGYAFIDGHHEEIATVQYFHQLLPHIASPCLMVFDDINWTDGMQRAWQEILSHSSVSLAVDLGAIGVCLIKETANNKFSCRIPLRGL